MDQEALRGSLSALMQKGRQSLGNLEPRIEILMRACLAADLKLPGVTIGQFKHPVSPKGEQIVQYLRSTFKSTPAVARSVQVTVYRYQDAEKAVERAQGVFDEGLELDQTLLEELKLKLFYLTRFHVEFKDERVISQLFPAPVTTTASAKPAAGTAPGTAPLSTVDRLKAKQAAQAVLHKAEILASKLAPKFEIVALALDMLSKRQGLNVGSFFTPATRSARFLAMSLGSAPELVTQLKEAHALFLKLQEQLVEARKTSIVEPLKATIFPLSRLALSFRSQVLLKDLFTFGEEDLFAEGGEEAPAPAEGGDPGEIVQAKLPLKG